MGKVATVDERTHPPKRCTTVDKKNNTRNQVPVLLAEAELRSRPHLLFDTDTAMSLAVHVNREHGKACRAPLLPQLINKGEKLGFNS